MLLSFDLIVWRRHSRSVFDYVGLGSVPMPESLDELLAYMEEYAEHARLLYALRYRRRPRRLTLRLHTWHRILGDVDFDVSARPRIKTWRNRPGALDQLYREYRDLRGKGGEQAVKTYMRIKRHVPALADELASTFREWVSETRQSTARGPHMYQPPVQPHPMVPTPAEPLKPTPTPPPHTALRQQLTRKPLKPFYRPPPKPAATPP